MERASGHQDYLGLNKTEATAKATANNLVWRVIKEDGRSFPATMDYRPERLNFIVENGVIVKVTTG